MRALSLSAMVVVGLACASSPQSAPPDPQPLLPSLKLTWQLVDAHQPRVIVLAEAPGDGDGETEVILPGHPSGSLAFLRARDAGRRVQLECEELSAGRLRIHHPPYARVIVELELSPNEHRRSLDPQQHYVPLLEAGLMHWIGGGMPTWTHLDEGQPVSAVLRWVGFEEAGWKSISSFGRGPGPLRITSAIERIQGGLFLAGALTLFDRDVHGSRLMVSVFGNVWQGSLEQFADLCAEIVSLEREFFKDLEHDPYLISLIPVGDGRGRMSMRAGTALESAFACFLTPDQALQSEHDVDIPWLLAHEMFHSWNGRVIGLAPPEQLGYWFSEGFSDFYARRLLQRGGFLDDEGYRRSLEARRAEYDANPERDAPATRIQEAFWSDSNVGLLPYQRGDLVADMVDRAIQHASDGERSLDDLMRDLLRRARAGEGPFSTEDLLAAISAASDEETAGRVRRIVVAGGPIEE